ncbi:MAG: N-acetylmuramoyl-L-alanine amidase [Roseiflexaceae bacterium]|nr:N-acetylmuramoyl-L-alanine amidase [Roseiflexaceae bacterium]
MLATIRRPRNLLLATVPLAFALLIIPAPSQPASPATSAPGMALFPPTLTPTSVPPTPTPLPTPEPPTPAPIAAAPAPQPQPSEVRVGLQVGHWKSNELPDELNRLRTSSGTAAGGVTELQVNLDITNRVAELLRSRGIITDVLPATVPPGYQAAAFISIHADGSPNTKARGFKLATPWRTSRAAQHLQDVMVEEYRKATEMPRDGAITMNMRGYYAFSWRRHTHAVAKTTPSVIVEMGFLTNPTDRAMLTSKQDLIAKGIANGIIRYLNERDVADLGALEPPDFKQHRPASPDGVVVRAIPADTGKVIARAGGDARLSPFQERDGWFQVFVRGSGGVIGWVRRDQLIETDDPLPTPLPATDS